ncbi:unnamed protein product [Caenorhabditis sp. 36 PRJEB53466]|nr:unnamed protein product [Caenorhabditis sp. 36 PRJEB53466]
MQANRLIQLPYAVDINQNKSICHACKGFIKTGVVRMTIRNTKQIATMETEKWMHCECFWRSLKRGVDDINGSSIGGMDRLDWNTQEMIREQIRRFKFEPETSPTFTGTLVDFKNQRIAKSASNRGKCSKCFQFFEKDELKMMMKMKSYHARCHFESIDKFLGRLDDIPGWMGQEEKWKEKTIQAFEEIHGKREKDPKCDENSGNPSNESYAMSDGNDEDLANLTFTIHEMSFTSDGYSSSKTSSPADSQTSSKRSAAPNEEEADTKRRRLARMAKIMEIRQKKMRDQADRMFALRQCFRRIYLVEIKSIFVENDQDECDDAEKARDLLVDMALFGNPITCQECLDGKITYNSIKQLYECNGYKTVYTRCRFTSKNPVRTPFVMPARFIEKYQLQTVIFNQMHERIYPKQEEIVNKVEGCGSPGDGNTSILAAEAFEAFNSLPTNVVNPATATTTHILKNGTLVDAKCPHAYKSHVVKPYQAALSMTDVTENKNSYYKIQLLKEDSAELFHLFSSWGRVGTDFGGHYTESFNEKVEAIRRFEQLFSQKTKNEWKYRKYFRKLPGQFNYVETDFSELETMDAHGIEPGSRTKLPIGVKEVVMAIFDVEKMKAALKSFDMDLEKMPLGQLSRNQIKTAFGVLTKLSWLVVTENNGPEIVDATNKFYTLIPHSFGMKSPEPLDTPSKIKKKSEMLTALLEIKYAYDLGTDRLPRSLIQVDPVDINYEKLKCVMSPLPRGCQDWEYIESYMKNTRGSTHHLRVDLVDILIVNRANESGKFRKDLGNRKLLWHGSARMNFAGILGHGLRIAPPEAPSNGYMFGKGVYFTDMFSKSFFYCRAKQTKEEVYLLLCDVALGTPSIVFAAQNLSAEKLPAGTHSVHAIGRECPHEIGTVLHKDGFEIPTGHRKTQLHGQHGVNFHLLYNEYIVYDVDQIELKYLVRVRVHEAKHLQ